MSKVEVTKVKTVKFFIETDGSVDDAAKLADKINRYIASLEMAECRIIKEKNGYLDPMELVPQSQRVSWHSQTSHWVIKVEVPLDKEELMAGVLNKIIADLRGKK